MNFNPLPQTKNMMQEFRLQGNPVQRRPNKCNYFSQQEFIHLQLKIQPLVASYFVAAKITETSRVSCFTILVYSRLHRQSSCSNQLLFLTLCTLITVVL